jgi:alkylation response protein AidB-like acyl-CoA dehydrogenase
MGLLPLAYPKHHNPITAKLFRMLDQNLRATSTPPIPPDYPEIRDAVAKLCERFPGEYWRALDREEQYPKEFVDALTEAGYLAVLLPDEYGGAGLPLSAAAAILEEVQRAGCNAAACHAQMYTMGTVLRHGSPEQKQRHLPDIASGRVRLQAFGVTEPTSGTDTTSLKTFARREGDHYVVRGQKIWTSRAEHSDLMLLLARTTPQVQVRKQSEGLSVFLVDMREARGRGLTIRPIRTMSSRAAQGDSATHPALVGPLLSLALLQIPILLKGGVVFGPVLRAHVLIAVLIHEETRPLNA